MASASTQRVASGEDFQRWVALINGADSVELKLTVPEADQRGTVTGLGLDPLDAQIRQVFFFETPDLALDAHGVVVRLRRVQGEGRRLGRTVRSAGRVRRSPSFGVEVDAMPGGFVCSGSMKQAMGAGAVSKVVTTGRPARSLFSKEQRAFFAEHAPEGVALDDPTILGPIFVLEVNSPKGFARRLVAELRLYPGRPADSRIVDEMPADEGVPGSSRGEGVPHRARASALRRSADEARTALEFFSDEALGDGQSSADATD